MENYSEKQIKIWENSLITVYRAGWMDGTRELGWYALRSLFYEGFSRSKRINGHTCIYTAGGIELEIHSASLAKALLKKLEQHKSTRMESARKEIEEIMLGMGKNTTEIKLQASSCDLGCNTTDSAEEEYTLFATASREKWVFSRLTWNAPLEFVKIIK